MSGATEGGPPPAGILDPMSAPDVVDVLHDAFFHYPVMRFVLGREGDYAARLRGLLTFFVRARVLRDEVLLGVPDPEGGANHGSLSAAALVSYPDRRTSPDELAELREATWADLGADTRARYEAFGEAVPDFEIEPAHVHLNMIGVRPRAQGRGLARSLLSRVHALSESDAESAGVTLTTEVESNVPLYRHFGYDVLGSAEVASAFTTWAMFRPDG